MSEEMHSPDAFLGQCGGVFRSFNELRGLLERVIKVSENSVFREVAGRGRSELSLERARRPVDDLIVPVKNGEDEPIEGDAPVPAERAHCRKIKVKLWTRLRMRR
jgi:hypothetical protein